MPITKEQIYSIADGLNKEGIKPTLAMVRRRLGSGSFTTISEALTEWKIIQNTLTNPPEELIPERIKELYSTLGARLWSEAMHLASKQFNQEREAIENKFNEKEAYYSELEKLSQEYDTELVAAKACIQELRERITKNEEEHVALRQQVDQSQSNAQVLERENMLLKEELTRTLKRSDNLEKNLATLVTHFESMQKQFVNKTAPRATAISG